MSGNNVDIPEVNDFSDDLHKASTDIRSQLDEVKESIETINSMSSFSGEAAKEAKNYFNELHLTILESFRGLFDDLEGNLQQHLQAFESKVDVSESAVVRSEYLGDVKEDVNKLFEKLEKQDEAISDTIKDVSDISSATPPSFSDVDEWKTKAIKKLKELDEDLESFTGEGNETDVQSIMNKIETAMNNAKTSEGKVRFADFEGASNMKELAKLQDYNEEKKEETISEVHEENIDELSLSEIEKAKDKELNYLEDGAEDVLNMAFKDLKEGEIDRQKYLSVLNGLKDFDKDVKQGNEDIEVSPELNDYINGDDNKNTDDVIDTSGKMTKDGLSVAPLFAAYGLHKKGFEIQKYKTKGKGMVRYRVYNPEAVGISKPKNRDTKIYDKKNVDQQVKRGKSGNKTPIAGRVNARAGAVSGLKTKAGWLGVAIDTGLNVKDNIKDDASTQRIVGDAGVDVGIGAVSLAAAGTASAIAVGTFGAPVLVGVAAGFVASTAISAVAGWEIGGKSVSDHVKDGVQSVTDGVKSGIDTVAGWFK